MSDAIDEHLLDHGKSPFHYGSLADASNTHVERSLVCGDEVHLQLRIEGPTVAAAWFLGRGCLVSQAAASILCARIDNRPLADVVRVTEEDVVGWIGVPLSPVRRNCGLLAFRALRRILSDLGPSGENDP